jgi:hypothetical protein
MTDSWLAPNITTPAASEFSARLAGGRRPARELHRLINYARDAATANSVIKTDSAGMDHVEGGNSQLHLSR